MRYGLFGIGRQGLAALYDLVKNCQASAVFGVDLRFADKQFRKRTQQRLDSLLGDATAGVELSAVDFTADAPFKELSRRLKGFDCIVSALPYSLNARLSELAIASGVPMCDMGGNPTMVAHQMALARKHKHVIVPECGLAPGIVNVFIKHLAVNCAATSIRAYCGGLPKEKPDAQENPLQYKLVFSPAGLISEYMGQSPVLRGGQLQYEPVLTGLERFDDDHEAFYTSNNSPLIFEYMATLGVRDCAYKTLRYHGHLEKIRLLHMLGFLQEEGNSDPGLEWRLASCSVLKFDRDKDRDKIVVSVHGTSDDSQAKSIELVQCMDEQTRFTAMEQTTSWGTTIVAHALARGVSRPADFSTPEQFIDTEWFMSELQRRSERFKIE